MAELEDARNVCRDSRLLAVKLILVRIEAYPQSLIKKTAYGKSKLAGERYVKEFTYKHFIIRSTWVYGLGNNFINQLLEKVDQGENLSNEGKKWKSESFKEKGIVIVTRTA